MSLNLWVFFKFKASYLWRWLRECSEKLAVRNLQRHEPNPKRKISVSCQSHKLGLLLDNLDPIGSDPELCALTVLQVLTRSGGTLRTAAPRPDGSRQCPGAR